MLESSERAVLIYVSGNNGSGKSTLARALAARIGYAHLPEERFETSYLTDLFAQQRRWSFEAQAHFLAFKIAQVQNAIANSARVFIDRSPYEDAEVFARYFYETGKMDRRSYRTYGHLYRALTRGLPEPDLIIYCDCSLAQLALRVEGRGRDYERLYPKNHLRHLDQLYRAWLNRAARLMPGKLFRIDTGSIDVRSPTGDLDRVAADVHYLLTLGQTLPQIQLPFDSDTRPPQTSFFEPEAFHNTIQPYRYREPSPDKKLMRRPVAYIAAPFTGKATAPNGPAEPAKSETLFQSGGDAAHGLIRDPEYRAFLESIESTILACGYDTFLPHRDVNRWGVRTLTPRQACAECSSAIFASDVLVAYPQSSLGSHYEIGVAIGYGLPVVVLMPEGERSSFMMEGISSQSNVSEIRFGSAADLGQRLSLCLKSLAAKALD